MKVNLNFTAEFKDKNQNAVVKVECFPETAESDVWIIRVTNFIYGNCCVKKETGFDKACQTLDKEVEKYQKLLEQTKSQTLAFRNRYVNKDKA